MFMAASAASVRRVPTASRSLATALWRARSRAACSALQHQQPELTRLPNTCRQSCRSKMSTISPVEPVCPNPLTPTLSPSGRGSPVRHPLRPKLRPVSDCLRLTPHVGGSLHHKRKLCLLIIDRERPRADAGGKAALRAEAQLLEGQEFCGLIDAPLERVFRLELAPLGGDETQHDLLAFRHEAQRRKTAGTLIVVFEEIAVHVEAAEQHFADRIVAAARKPRGRHPG